MSKYVEGLYEVKANKIAFDKFYALEQKLKLVRGIVQNDMLITHDDLEIVEEEINCISTALMTIFENVLEEAVYKGETA